MAGAAETLDLTQFSVWADRQASALPNLDYSPALRACSIMLTGETRKNFDEGHGPDGTPWLPLAAPRDLSKFSESHQKKIQKARAANKSNHDRPLRDKGLLMASAMGSGEGAIKQITPNELTQGTNLEYAATHQYGRDVPERKRDRPWVFPAPDGTLVFTKKIKAHKIPARPFLGINESISMQATEILGDFFAEQLAKFSLVFPGVP